MREECWRHCRSQFDIGNEAFPYMAAGQITVCGGVAARLYRISFSESSLRNGVGARYGDSLATGADAGGRACMISRLYGTEALGVMPALRKATSLGTSWTAVPLRAILGSAE